MEPTRVVFFIDSKAAISALSSNRPTECLRTIQCRVKLSEAISNGWAVVLQWVPSHVGICGNEHADRKAKQGAESAQPPTPMTLSRAKSLINSTINYITGKTLKLQSIGKRWEGLATEGPIPANLERAEAVARFRLLTGHDYLQAHLHRIGIADSKICPLCSTARMDGDHLHNCQALSYPMEDITNRYWEARRRMVEEPRTGVG
jgi:hypothetical protein